VESPGVAAGHDSIVHDFQIEQFNRICGSPETQLWSASLRGRLFCASLSARQFKVRGIQKSCTLKITISGMVREGQAIPS
jgi:hypothetical protein